MYAKGLVPGPPHAIATLTATTSDGDILMSQLLDRGWGWLGEPSPATPAGHLTITHGRLQLVVDDQLVLDDLNPASPRGWWGGSRPPVRAVPGHHHQKRRPRPHRTRRR